MKQNNVKIKAHSKNLSQEEKEKYKNMIRYIAYKYPGIGKTQLAKLFLYADSDFYRIKEKTICGDDYIKNKYGPTPCNLYSVVEELENEGEIVFSHERVIDYSKQMLHLSNKTSINKHNVYNLVKDFDREAILKITEKASLILNSTARELSNDTHGSIYHALEMDEQIPNCVLPYYFDEELNDDERALLTDEE